MASHNWNPRGAPTRPRGIDWLLATPQAANKFPVACGCRALHNSSLVTQEAPDFSATAVMPDGSFSNIRLSENYKGKFVILLFYPLDFTFVCPSEILAFNKAHAQFKKRGVEIIGCSTDSHYSHLAWRNTPLTRGGIGNVQFALVSDLTKQIATDYGVLLPAGIALRGLFILNADHKVCHALVNDLPIGRSVEEALRLIDAIQFSEASGEVCPANWKSGEEGIKPTAVGLSSYLADHYDASGEYDEAL